VVKFVKHEVQQIIDNRSSHMLICSNRQTDRLTTISKFFVITPLAAAGAGADDFTAADKETASDQFVCVKTRIGICLDFRICSGKWNFLQSFHNIRSS